MNPSADIPIPETETTVTYQDWIVSFPNHEGTFLWSGLSQEWQDVSDRMVVLDLKKASE